MNLYIFEPHENFNYCGGALVVIAPNFDSIEPIVRASYDEKEYGDPWGTGDYEVELLQSNKEYKNGTNKWVLRHIFEVSSVLEPRVVTWNYNYA